MNIMINGIILKPQPTNREWQVDITGQKLNGTQETGAYQRLIISSPKRNGQYFNWKDFENQVLDSITVFAPGDTPEDDYVTYSTGVVSKKIASYQIPEDQTVTGVSMEIMIIVDSEFSSFA